MKTLIIAEAGVNHNGSLDVARRMIEVAAQSGADLIKFQSFRADALVSKHAAKAEYQKGATNPDETQYDMVRQLELSKRDHEALMQACRDHGIGFFSTPFDEISFDMLFDLGLRLVKVPSGELTNLPLLRHVGARNLPVILSTGMADLTEVGAALSALEAVGTPRNRITLLHCTTEYPAPLVDVNLRAMLTMKESFGTAVGYSDHTRGIHIPMAAVAMGATIIEKHFTLDRQLPGPDHQASLEPAELKAMVQGIREVELALGDGVKRLMPSEAKNLSVARRSLVARRAIVAGEVFSAVNVVAKRPGTGMSPMRWDEVMGRTAPRSFDIDEPIEL